MVPTTARVHPAPAHDSVLAVTVGSSTTSLAQTREHQERVYGFAVRAQKFRHNDSPTIDWALEASYWGDEAAEWAESVWPVAVEVVLDEA